MNRRRLLLSLTALAAAFRVRAQSPRVYRVGVLRPTAAPRDNFPDLGASFARAMREAGYVEGQNLILLHRYADNKLERLPALATALVERRPDVILAVSAASVRAARAVTSSIPIVFFGNFDPVANGFVASLAQPGANTTGILIAPDGTLAAKRMELLTQAVPGTKRVAMMFPDDPNTIAQQRPEAVRAAAALGVQLDFVTVRNSDYAGAFAQMAAARAEAVFLAATTYFVINRRQIIALAAKHRLPAIYEWPEQVEDGGLMSYGPPSLLAIYRRIALQIDKILKGANAGDIPVEQPSKVELVINLKTAKAMGLALPQTLLLRADRLIE